MEKRFSWNLVNFRPQMTEITWIIFTTFCKFHIFFIVGVLIHTETLNGTQPNFATWSEEWPDLRMHIRKLGFPSRGTWRLKTAWQYLGRNALHTNNEKFFLNHDGSPIHSFSSKFDELWATNGWYLLTQYRRPTLRRHHYLINYWAVYYRKYKQETHQEMR